MAKFLGITREAIFSPGRVGDDARILLEVATQLRTAGHQVEVIAAAEPRWPAPDARTVVFTMAQGEVGLQRLREWESAGVRVINSVAGVLNCQRYRTVPLLGAADISFPASEIVCTSQPVQLPSWFDDRGAWIKRGDVHATEADDVVFAADAPALRHSVARFARRGIERAVIQRHVGGAVIKFYAARGGFFSHVPANGGAALAPSVQAAIAELGQRAAAVLGVEIYGGDCVLGAGDDLTLIDLNDWPSYARCRFSAAAAIAAYLGAQGTAGT